MKTSYPKGGFKSRTTLSSLFFSERHTTSEKCLAQADLSRAEKISAEMYRAFRRMWYVASSFSTRDYRISYTIVTLDCTFWSPTGSVGADGAAPTASFSIAD